MASQVAGEGAEIFVCQAGTCRALGADACLAEIEVPRPTFPPSHRCTFLPFLPPSHPILPLILSSSILSSTDALTSPSPRVHLIGAGKCRRRVPRASHRLPRVLQPGTKCCDSEGPRQQKRDDENPSRNSQPGGLRSSGGASQRPTTQSR